jgi:hypothetical protein
VAGGDLEAALAGVAFALGEPTAVVALEANGLATWEIAWVSEPYASVILASQAAPPAAGWPWATLIADLAGSPDQDAGSFATGAVQRYGEVGGPALSAIDLGQVRAVEEALDALVSAALASAPAEVYAAGVAAAWDFQDGEGVDHDLGDLLAHLAEADVEPSVLAAAASARAAVEALVPAMQSEAERATGLSIYAPGSGEPDPRYMAARWALETRWEELIDAGLEGAGE